LVKNFTAAETPSGRKIAFLLRKPKLEADGYSDFPNNAREAGKVNECNRLFSLINVPTGCLDSM